MHLVELFLPLTNADEPFSPDLYDQVRKTLTQRFGGMTSFGRSPAEGTFRDEGRVVQDDIVVYEVMVEELDRNWWNKYRAQLEKVFVQDEILVRATMIERL